MENSAKKLAIEYKVSKKSRVNTFPIFKLIKSQKNIVEANEVLNESINKNVPISPSGEWILDNFYLIEEQINLLKKEITEKQYVNLPGINGKARIYFLAEQLVKITDGNINEENIIGFIMAYQSKKFISMKELWLFPTVLKIAIINYIGNICVKIISAQKQKFKVESLVERIIESKNIDEQKFKKYRYFKVKNEATSYVEYMIYLLNKAGKEGKVFLRILENEIVKAGTTSNDVIKVEHYDIALNRVSMANSITSIRNLSRMNFANIFERINNIDYILKEDEFYLKMDFRTRNMYRENIQKISQKTMLSEIYIAKMLIEKTKEERVHIGEYIFGNKKEEFLEIIGYVPNDIDKIGGVIKKYKLLIYLFFIYAPTFILSFYISKAFFAILLIPISEIFVNVVNKIVIKNTKPNILPKLQEIDEQDGVFVIVPTLLTSTKRVEELIRKLEVYYLGNKLNNVYFALLGDASETDSENMPYDKEIIETGINEVNKLNQKYGKDIFFFLYRKRIYNSKQEKYLGYERKRGMICEFNKLLLEGEKGTFLVNTINIDCTNIKYVTTLDADTELGLGTLQSLIGIMQHPLNKPKIGKKGIIEEGYGIIQPKVGVSIKSATASSFAQIYAGSGGIDIYSTSDSNVYQDLFNEGIFTGKGIYDLRVFEEVLKNKIPENTVLSHDLLEGSYLRCGLASDVEVIDGFPARVNSYMIRQKRWTRGDWQIVKWLFSNQLNSLSKYKIFDNLRRSLVDVFLLVMFFIGLEKLALLIVFFPLIIDIVDKVLNIGSVCGKVSTQNYKPIIDGVKGSFYRCLLNLMFIPYRAILMLEAIITTIYRMTISKKHLLEWLTAEDAEKTLGKNIECYLREMGISGLIAFALVLKNFNSEIWLSLILYVIWFLCPFISFEISKINNKRKQKITKEEEIDILDIAKRTWKFFDTYMTKENNYLPPDNFQEGRKNEIVDITSSTNIGLGIISIITAYDMGFISKDNMIIRVRNILDTIMKLEKWNGHLFNWYNIKTLKPLQPAFVSTVDSGNFIGYMYVLKSLLKQENEKQMYDVVNNIIESTNFNMLFNEKMNLLSLGYDMQEKKIIDSNYDLLASEARLASLVAIAKRDISYKHWFNLGRTITTIDRYKGLLSWGGTMFEYFMPNIIVKNYEYTLMDETYEFCLYSQKKYAKELDIPWGISEAAFNLKDLNYNYQYKAFGIPWLGVKRGLEKEIVVSPYSSILAISKSFKDVFKNIKKLKNIGAYGKFGFYDAVDYTPNRVDINDKKEVVKTYMAHHQGLIMASINNFLNNNILNQRFEENPEIQAIDILLQERVPQNMVLVKEKKEKVQVLKYEEYEEYRERNITKTNNNVNILSNDKYTVVIDDLGKGYSMCGNTLITRYKEDMLQGHVIYIKNMDNMKSWSSTLMPTMVIPDEYRVIFSPAVCKFFRTDDGIDTVTKITVSPEDDVEIRQLKITNNNECDANIDVITYLELAMSTQNDDIVHPAFNNLFIYPISHNGACILEKRNRYGRKSHRYFINFIVRDDNGKSEIELDKSKIIGRRYDMSMPYVLHHDRRYENNIMITPNMAVSYKCNLNIKQSESRVVSIICGYGNSIEDVKRIYDKYTNQDMINRTFDLAVSRSMVENRFFRYTEKDIVKFDALFSKVLYGDKNRNKFEENIKGNTLKQRDLWGFGISGDLPIILLKIKRVNEYEIIQELISALEYFNRKNIKIDLIILNEEPNSYEEYVREKIYEIISSKNLNYLLNANGGIHIVRAVQITKEEKNLLYACSDVILDAHFGNLEEQLYENE